MAERLRSYDELVSFLVAQRVPHAADAANASVELATTPPALPSPLIVRWERTVPFLTVIQQMSAPVPEPRVREIETALLRVNDVAMIPGYAFSYADKVIYYRFSLPLFVGELTSEAFDHTLIIVANNARQLAPALQRVIDGADGANVLELLASST